MDSITCDVIDARDGRPIIGMPVMLKSLSQTTPLKTIFRGCTAFDGQVHLWRPEGDVPGGILDNFIQDLEDNMDEEAYCSIWQMGFDTLGFFGRDATSWPMLNVIFYLTRRKFWTHHVSVVLGPYEYTSSVTMRPTINMEQNFVRNSQMAHAPQHQQDTQLGSEFGGSQMAYTPQHQPGSDSEVTVYSGSQTTSNAKVQRPKPARQFLSHHQRTILRQAYATEPYPSSHVYDQLSSELRISKKKVRAWYASVRFQHGISKIKVNVARRLTSKYKITESLPIAIDPALLSEHGNEPSPLALSPDEAEPDLFVSVMNDEVVDDNVEALPCDQAGRKRDCKGRFAKNNVC